MYEHEATETDHAHQTARTAPIAPRLPTSRRGSNLFARYAAGGSSAAKLRSYLKSMGDETWSYVNWLTHAKNAAHFDAEIGIAITSHLLATVTASAMRASAQQHDRCANCDSYAVLAGECQSCGRIDESYAPPSSRPELSEEEVTARLAEPCIPTSDISTYLTPDRFGQRP